MKISKQELNQVKEELDLLRGALQGVHTGRPSPSWCILNGHSDTLGLYPQLYPIVQREDSVFTPLQDYLWAAQSHLGRTFCERVKRRLLYRRIVLYVRGEIIHLNLIAIEIPE
jgi:hypothetical protein